MTIKSLISVLMLSFSISLTTFAQENQGSRQRYATLVAQGKYDEAITEGIAIKDRLKNAGMNEDMFKMFQSMEQTIQEQEHKTGTTNWPLRYRVQKERLKVYMSWNYADRSKKNYETLSDIASHLKENSQVEDWLLTKANYCSVYGTSEQVTACYKTLLARRREGKNMDDTEKCFQEVINTAKERKNNTAAAVLSGMLKAWQDSVATERIAEQLRDVQHQYDDAQATLAERDTTIVRNKSFIGVLLAVVVILAAALVLAILLWLRGGFVIRRLRKSLNIANESNEQKAHFIGNISNQLRPLMGNTEKLSAYLSDVERYSEMESLRDQPYDKESLDMPTLCTEIMNEAKNNIPTGVDTYVEATPSHFNSNEQLLKDMLGFIIKTTACQPDTHKVSLEFKKRGPHSGDLIITNYGSVIPEEIRETIFNAFQGSSCPCDQTGLGYPICAMMAFRLGTTLQLDNEFHKGTRFLLKIKE